MSVLKEDNGQFSGMRLALIAGLIMTCCLMFALIFVIAKQAMDGIEINWMGASAFLAGIAAFMGVFITGKVQQKKTEGNVA